MSITFEVPYEAVEIVVVEALRTAAENLAQDICRTEGRHPHNLQDIYETAVTLAAFNEVLAYYGKEHVVVQRVAEKMQVQP